MPRPLFFGRLAVLAVVLAAPAWAQSGADWPAADPADVATVDAVLETVYQVISGPSDQERDWDRFRSLMHPQARLIPTGERDGAGVASVLSVEDYVERAGRSFRESPTFQGKGFTTRPRPPAASSATAPSPTSGAPTRAGSDLGRRRSRAASTRSSCFGTATAGTC